MSYPVFEMSREDGLPANLFLIQWGDAAESYIAYTDADVPVTHGGIVYQPTVIGREKIESSGSLDRKALNIDITPNASLVALYAVSPPSQKVALVIRQGHLSDPDDEFPVVWTGIIKNVTREPGIARIVGEPLDTLLARPGLRRHFMFGCPHVLYAEGTCGADRNRHLRSVTPTFIGGNFVRLPSGWHGPTAPEKFLGGYMQWRDGAGNTQIRTCVNFGADVNEIICGNTVALDPDTLISLYAGCNRQLQDCRDLHDNVVNYGGQPFIPEDNPVGFVNRYY